MLCAAAFALLAVSVARGHFPFILPESGGQSAKVVFSDDLAPDPEVNVEKMANTKLTLRDSGDKESALDWKKGDACYLVNIPGTGDRVVYGTTDYGVLQKGEGKPFKLTYFPKAVIGTPTAKAVGEKLPLEVVAVTAAGKVKFQVLAAGKPAPESEVTVILPDNAKKMVKTDKAGFTPEFEGTGRFGVVAKQIEAKAGEHGGKKYDEVRNYATLVCDVGK
jgi:uncharacterized GH25 family protein